MSITSKENWVSILNAINLKKDECSVLKDLSQYLDKIDDWVVEKDDSGAIKISCALEFDSEDVFSFLVARLGGFFENIETYDFLFEVFVEERGSPSTDVFIAEIPHQVIQIPIKGIEDFSKIEDSSILKRIRSYPNLLHRSAKYRHVNDTMKLLDYGFDVDARTDFGTTSLMKAAEAGKVETVALLLERGSDPRLKTVSGNSALNMADRRFDNDKVKELLIKKIQEIEAESIFDYRSNIEQELSMPPSNQDLFKS
ncbi:MAG: ankyrin repeat domain-containing protein [Methyloprofundus sp.]|nr:ankyrin repeat domain-containing protein [Methyloprofundus sp.]